MMKMRFVLTALLVQVALAGCRSEPDGVPVARLGAGPRAATAEAGAIASSLAPSRADARRLWVSEHVDFYASAISPDGRYVTQVDWTKGDLAVRDLATGMLHRLTDNGPGEESGDYASDGRFSRDGRQVAYAWYDAGTSDYEIHVLDFTVDDDGVPHGSGARLVYAGGGSQPASRLFDWASEDEVLIGIYRPDNSTALARLSVATGSLRVLKSFEWKQDPGQVAVSPDGRFIAYDQPSESDAGTTDIHLLSVDGRRETTLVEAPGDDVPLGWLSDGSLLFHRRQSSEGSVWRLPLSDGRPAGAPVLVQANVPHHQPLGVAGDALHYGLVVESPAFVTATIDFESRQLRRLPTRFEAPGVGTIVGLAWSPDGQHVIHRVDHPTSAGARMQLRRSDGRLVHEWNSDMWPMRTVLRWTPDGNSVVVPARDARERPGFIRMDLETGELEMVRRFDRGGEAGRVFAISPDGRTLYFTRHPIRDGVMDESYADIVAHDLRFGEERPIRRVHGHGNVTVSPDGKWLALATGTRNGETIQTTLQVVASDGSEARTVYRGAGADSPPPGEPDAQPVGDVLFCQCRVVGWSPDSRSILFLDLVDRTPDEPRDVELLRASVDGEVEWIATIPEYRGGATLHPDGRTIAYRTGEWRGEIWVMDGVGGSASAVMDTGGSR